MAIIVPCHRVTVPRPSHLISSHILTIMPLVFVVIPAQQTAVPVHVYPANQKLPPPPLSILRVSMSIVNRSEIAKNPADSDWDENSLVGASDEIKDHPS
jgi:hypothetical protein